MGLECKEKVCAKERIRGERERERVRSVGESWREWREAGIGKRKGEPERKKSEIGQR